MDVLTVVISIVSTAAGIASAIVAIVQARSAKASESDAVAARNDARIARDESQRLATIANAAFIRQAEAQERANEIKEKELAPPDWAVRWIRGELYAVTNTSMRTIVVDRFEVSPDATEHLVQVSGPQSGIYEAGDSFEYLVLRLSGPKPMKLTAFWRYEGEADESSFIIPL